MRFNSPEFAVFFPLVTLLFFATPYRSRWITLLAASCVFYMAFIPIYIGILGGTILIDYVAGILIERSCGRRRRLLLIASLVSNFGLLGVFKYYNFFAANIEAMAHAFGGSPPLPVLETALPIGLSFHTFQATAYTIEVYRGHQRAERHLGLYALYVMFFPQLVAGPIERPQHLLPQFRLQQPLDPRRVASGLKLMTWGLLKKVVIADRLATVVNPIYGMPTLYHGPALMLATFFFSWQIYCDFSGYSDIAVGAADVMGFDLMTNFRRPYLSRSLSEFWTRWHISLSTWFRDYVYIPLGGRHVARGSWCANILITFMISGLWHGANWTFVIWGMVNGLLLAGGALSAGIRRRLRHAIGLDRHPGLLTILQTAVTFGFITLTWVFFRASTLSDAGYILGHLLDHGARGLDEINVSRIQLWIAFLSVGVLASFEACIRDGHPWAAFNGAPPVLRWCVYYGLVIVILGLGVFGGTRFIYFQF